MNFVVSVSNVLYKNNTIKAIISRETKRATKPLRKEYRNHIDKIKAITDAKSLVAAVAEFKRGGSSTLFSDIVTQDDKNSEVMSYKLWQGGLGLPDREYYFKSDSATSSIREAYQNYIAKILTMSGDDTATANNYARKIIALETGLARNSRKIEDLRDPYTNYNKTAITDLPKNGGECGLEQFHDHHWN